MLLVYIIMNRLNQINSICAYNIVISSYSERSHISHISLNPRMENNVLYFIYNVYGQACMIIEVIKFKLKLTIMNMSKVSLIILSYGRKNSRKKYYFIFKIFIE
jgi:hypothetical protein